MSIEARRVCDICSASLTDSLLACAWQSLVYAHPSERYLKIVRDGAAHSKLDPDFQQYLGSLQGYRCTEGPTLSFVRCGYGTVMLEVTF